MAIHPEKVVGLFAACREEGIETLYEVIFTEFGYIRALIADVAEWDAAESVQKADRAIQAAKSYLAGSTSLEDCLWLRGQVETELRHIPYSEDKQERATHHYLAAVANLPLIEEEEQGEVDTVGDLLCFMYLWYPDTLAQNTQRHQLTRMKATFNAILGRRQITARAAVGGDRLRVSLLATC